jgi:hypothetical protein
VTARDESAALDPDRCAARSLARGEPLLGTASRVRHWVLLEEPGPWGRTALRDARLPEEVAGTLRRLAQAPLTKVLLIRRPHRSGTTPTTLRTLLVASSSATTGGWVRSRTLADSREVVDLADTLAAAATDGAAPPSWHAEDGPLLLVCTHGRHDTCCAELGRPLAAAVATAEPQRTWEVSHVGGDRFAGNVVVLPTGLYLGRVPPALAADVVAMLQAGRIPVPYLRGRSTYGVATQAAEVFVRRELGVAGSDELRLARHDVAGDRTTATFARPDGSLVVATVRGTHATTPWRLTCNADHDNAPHVFVLESLDALPA